MSRQERNRCHSFPRRSGRWRVAWPVVGLLSLLVLAGLVSRGCQLQRAVVSQPKVRSATFNLTRAAPRAPESEPANLGDSSRAPAPPFTESSTSPAHSEITAQPTDAPSASETHAKEPSPPVPPAAKPPDGTPAGVQPQTPVQPAKVAAPDSGNPAAQVHQILNAVRVQAGRQPLAVENRLSSIAQAGATAMARAVEQNPLAPATPTELDLDRIDALLPDAAQLGLLVLAVESLAECEDKLSEYSETVAKELTHVGVGAAPVRLAPGEELQVAVLLLARIVPELSPQALTVGQHEFHATCHHCGKQMVVQLDPKGLI